MKKLVILSAAVLLSVSSISFASTLQSLTKAQAIQTVKGKTITTIPLVTLDNKLINNSFTGYFDTNGQVKGQLATKPDNGGPQTDQGTWKITSDGALCSTWDHWNQGKQICVSMFKLENSILFINKQNKKLETIVLQDDIKTGNDIG